MRLCSLWGRCVCLALDTTALPGATEMLVLWLLVSLETFDVHLFFFVYVCQRTDHRLCALREQVRKVICMILLLHPSIQVMCGCNAISLS